MKQILTLVIIFITFISFSQRDLKSKAVTTPIIGFHYKGNFPGADMTDKWGFNNTLGGDVAIKLKSNLEFGLDGGFIFGSTFKDSSIFENVINSYGTITAASGAPGDVFFYLRGMNINMHVGYVFSQLGHNPNSGLWVNVGAGYMFHKIRIESLFDDVVFLEGDYRKGYDKLTMGFTTKEFIGYLFQHNRRFLNFYAGFEFVQGFTKNVRTYNFDTKGVEDAPRLDYLNSFKIGWMIPIYKGETNEYYYD